ncbi:MAG: outer membrane beta-barrel protein [Pseudomonadota bacterium]
MKFRSGSLVIGAAVALTVGSAAQAQSYADDESVTGFYLGGGAAQSRFDSGTFTLDHKDNGWKLIAGTRLTNSFAIEANYVDFGKAIAPAIVLLGPTATKASAYSVFVLGITPAGMFDLYLKAGAARTRAKGQINDQPFSKHSCHAIQIGFSRRPPLPVSNLGQILAMDANVLLVLDQLFLE